MKNAPAVIPEITRVKHLNILGITVDEMLAFSEHGSVEVSQAHQQLYALKALKAHGLSGTALHNVYNAVFLPTITYASQSWWGFVSAADKQKLSSLVHKVTRWNLDGGVSLPELDTECLKFDRTLFGSILTVEQHVLHQLLPEIKVSSNNLRKRSHNQNASSVYCSHSQIFYKQNAF